MVNLVAQHRSIEAQIKSLQKELEQIEQDPAYATERAFADALASLMDEYGKTPRDIILILDPDSAKTKTERPPRGPAPGSARKRLRYQNPHTGDVVETAGGNHKVLKEWRLKYPESNIKDWIVGEG